MLILGVLAGTGVRAAESQDLTLLKAPATIAAAAAEFQSGRSLRITPSGPVLLGQGFATLSAAPRDVGLVVNAAVTQRPELQANYTIDIIDSYSELASKLQVDASASVNYAAGGASARLNLLQTATIKSQSVYVLVSYRITNRIEQLSSFSLTSDAIGILKKSNGAFYSTYGDSFVHRIGFGSELHALMEIESVDNRSRQALRAEVEGHYGAFKAEASIETTFESVAKNHRIKVVYSQSGGNWGDEVKEGTADGTEVGTSRGSTLTLTYNELILRIRRFTKEARDFGANAEIIWADVLDYAACGNRPPTSKPFDPTLTRWLQQSLAEMNLELRQLGESWSAYLQNPQGYLPAANLPIDSDLAVLRALMARTARTIEYLGLYPNAGAAGELGTFLQLSGYVEAFRIAQQNLRPSGATIPSAITTAGELQADTACLAQPTATAQLACILRRGSPVAVSGPEYVYVSGTQTLNGQYQSLQTIGVPPSFRVPGVVPEFWIYLTRPGEDQFNYAHVERERTDSHVRFQVCVRRDSNQCGGYDGVQAHWIAKRPK